MNGDFTLNQLFYEITADDLYGMPVGVPNEVGAEGEVYDHVVLTNMIKIGKCTMLGDFFDGPMERPLKVFPWQQGYDLFNEVEYQVPQDALVPEVDFGILSAGLEPYTVTKTINNYNIEHNTNKWGFIKAKVTIAPVIIGPLEVRDEITTNGEHTIVKRNEENGMSSVTFTVNVPQGGGQVQEMWYNIPNNANGTTAVIEPNQGYIGISRLHLTVRPLVLVPRNVTIEENGEMTILPMEWQQGFSSVNITTNVPVTQQISTNIRYVSLVDDVGDDSSYYFDMEEHTVNRTFNSMNVNLSPGETLIGVLKINTDNDNIYDVYRFRLWSRDPGTGGVLPVTLDPGEYYVFKNHYTPIIVFCNGNKEMVSKAILVQRKKIDIIPNRDYMYAAININRNLINMPYIEYVNA